MGVQGLQTYMLQHSNNLHRHRLRNCYLVIDASNLAHHLYHLHNIEYLFAGEYGQYVRELRRAFSSMMECGITPLFVLDGAKDWSGPKLREQRARIEKRVKKCVQLDRGGGGAKAKNAGGNSNRLLPIMAMEVFISTVVDEFEFNLIVSAFGDADNHLASLAAQLGCPVLTNDSDFLIYDLPGGVVLTKTLHLTKALLDENEAKPAPFLDCQIYRVRDFYLPALRRKVNPSLLPLCATLIGNDYLSRGAVGRCILSRVQLPKSAGGGSSGGGGGRQLKSKSRRLIAGVLVWTHRNFASPDDCLAALRRLLLGDCDDLQTEDKRWAHRFLASVRESMAHYQLHSALALVEPPANAAAAAAASQSGLKLSFHSSLGIPQWLTESGLLEGRMSPLFLDVAQHGQLYLPVGIEDPSNPCTFDDTAPLRQAAYSLLLSRLGRLEHCSTIVEHRRVRGGLGKSVLPLIPDLPDGCCSDAASCLSARLGYPRDPLGDLVGHAGLKIVLYSVLASHRLLVGNNSTVPSPTCRSVCLSLLATCLYKLCQSFLPSEEAELLRRQRATVLAKYSEQPVINHRVGFDLQLVHCLSHFQATLLSASLLCQSHQPTSVSLPPVSDYISGKFVYNLAIDVESRKDGVLFLSELLGRKSQLCAVFHHLVGLIDD
uniref:XPG_I_2 domain-containing protein n=1 Tax=Macrostomum lignano TaxID=282301 RepID=A0A1I8FZM9_9PLAT